MGEKRARLRKNRRGAEEVGEEEEKARFGNGWKEGGRL